MGVQGPPQGGGGGGGPRFHDDAGTVQQLDVAVQLHRLQAPKRGRSQCGAWSKGWGITSHTLSMWGCGHHRLLPPLVGGAYLVTPGAAPTPQARLRFRLLMRLLLPTLGYPGKGVKGQRGGGGSPKTHPPPSQTPPPSHPRRPR